MNDEERLAKLERSCVRLKVAMGAALLLLLLLAVRSEAQRHFKAIVTERLSVVDSHGDLLCAIHEERPPGATADQASDAVLVVQRGESRIRIHVSTVGGLVEVLADNSQPENARVALSAIRGIGANVLTSHERAGVDLMNVAGMSRLIIRDSNGRHSILCVA